MTIWWPNRDTLDSKFRAFVLCFLRYLLLVHGRPSALGSGDLVISRKRNYCTRCTCKFFLKLAPPCALSGSVIASVRGCFHPIRPTQRTILCGMGVGTLRSKAELKREESRAKSPQANAPGQVAAKMKRAEALLCEGERRAGRSAPIDA